METKIDKSSKVSSFVKEEASFQKVIADFKERLAMQPHPSSINPSMLTECPRKILYKLRGISWNKKWEKYHHEALVSKWSTIFRSIVEIDVLAENILIADDDYNITSNADMIICKNEEVYVVNVYHVDTATLSKNEPKKKHVIENMVYTWLLGKKQGLIIYEEPSTLENRFFSVSQYQPIINSVKRSCREILTHQVQGTLIDRPYKSKSNECRSCNFINTCWAN